MLRILTPWDSQPQGVADLDPHWIARGLSFVSLGNGLYWSRNTDWRGASTVTGAPRRLGGKYDLSSGLGSTFGGGTTDRISTGIFLPYSTGFRSIVSFRYANSSGGGTFGRVFNPAGTTGVAANDESMFPNAATNGMAYCKAGATNWQWVATTPIVTGVWACDGVTHDQRSTGIRPVMYLNGLSVSVSDLAVGSGSYPTTGGLTIDLGNRSTDSARGWDGILGPLAIFDHASAGLTDQEHKALSDNPWQLFAPRSIWVPVSSSASGTSYTISPSGGITFSGSGTEVHTKVIDVSGGIAFAGTGSMAFATTGTTYTISPSGGITFSGTGVQVRSKTIAPEGGFTFSGSGLDLRTKVIDISGGVTFGGTGSMTSNTSVVTGTIGERTKVGVGT